MQFAELCRCDIFFRITKGENLLETNRGNKKEKQSIKHEPYQIQYISLQLFLSVRQTSHPAGGLGHS